MYRYNPGQMEFENFHIPFGGKLSADNRWVILASIIPWGEHEAQYAAQFATSGQGAPAFSVRIALGALIIKERLGTSDEETVEQIRENPYLQFFLGYDSYSDAVRFDASLFVHFRKGFTGDAINELSLKVVQNQQADKSEDRADDSDSDESGSDHSGKLIIDATCTPADITHPTDLKLLNAAREKSEEIIDHLHSHREQGTAKPRTYRKKARKAFLEAAMSKRLSTAKRKKAIAAQLNFIKRNVNHIATLTKSVPLRLLNRRLYKDLLVIHEIYRQQYEMAQYNHNRIDDRIVSLSQPHVRPIVRGKLNARTEFGAKVSASLSDGYIHLDRLSWDAYNESGDLVDQVDRYKARFGHYPESIHADKIYRNRANRQYCKEKGIRLSGPPLGRPQKGGRTLCEKKQDRKDETDRIAIEGKFGQGKRRFSLNRVMTKLRHTSECSIAISFFVMNLEKCLQEIFWLYFLSRETLQYVSEYIIEQIHRYSMKFSSDSLAQQSFLEAKNKRIAFNCCA